MLDESEFASVQNAHKSGTQEVRLARALADRPLDKCDTARVANGVAARYFELTGVAGLDTQEILRHRLSRLGAPCRKCSKELRSPQAKKCLECGHDVK